MQSPSCTPSWPAQTGSRALRSSDWPRPLLRTTSLPSSEPDPHTALAFFAWAARRPGYRHSIPFYAALLTSLLASNSPGLAKKMTVAMIKSCSSNTELRSVLQAARALTHEPIHGGKRFRLSLRAYNVLLISLSRFTMIDEMKDVYYNILQDGISPNICTYNTMTNAFCKRGDLDAARMYLSSPLQAGLRPYTFTYNSFVLGHCRSKDLDGARKMFEIMPQKGCQRDAVMYTILIHGLCDDQCVDEAFALFSGMTDDGCHPDVHAYTMLIKAPCDNGRSEEGHRWFRDMEKKGCQLNVHTYTVAIKV